MYDWDPAVHKMYNQLVEVINELVISDIDSNDRKDAGAKNVSSLKGCS